MLCCAVTCRATFEGRRQVKNGYVRTKADAKVDKKEAGIKSVDGGLPTGLSDKTYLVEPLFSTSVPALERARNITKMSIPMLGLGGRRVAFSSRTGLDWDQYGQIHCPQLPAPTFF